MVNDLELQQHYVVEGILKMEFNRSVLTNIQHAGTDNATNIRELQIDTVHEIP
jgi:hypothetical protein